MPDMTEFEQKFFETGELPPELAAEAEPVPALPELKVEPKIDPLASPLTLEPPVQDPTEVLRRSLQDEQTRRIQAETRLQDIEKQANAAKSVVAPDPNVDPLGSMFHQLKQVNDTVASLQTQLTQEQQNNLQRQQFQQFTNSIQQIKNEFVKTTPDFDAAYQHIRNTRTEDMRSFGVAEDQIPQMLAQTEFNMAQAAITNGKNPAEEMYNAAKRYGYVPKAAPKAAKMSPDEKLAQLTKGADAAKSPAKGAPDNELTTEGLQDADEASLSKFVQDDKLWAKLVGGGQADIFKH